VCSTESVNVTSVFGK